MIAGQHCACQLLFTCFNASCMYLGCVYLQARVHKRTKGTGCPYCSGQKVCVCNSFATHHADLARQWHPDPARNDGKTPMDYTYGSKVRAWWQCSNHSPPHEWQSRISDRSRRSAGCPLCSRDARQAQPQKSHGSLANEFPDLAAEWHPTLNEDLTPAHVRALSSQKVHWHCPKSACQHPHDWLAPISGRTNRHSRCPFCSGQKFCRCKSLAGKHPELLKEWDWNANGSKDPQTFSVGSKQEVYWCHTAADGSLHSWSSQIQSRTKSKGGCAVCSGKKYAAIQLMTACLPLL